MITYELHSAMRKIGCILCLIGTFFLSSCSTTAIRSTEVEVFRDGAKPDRPFNEIGILTDDGGLGEQGEIEDRMIRKAKKRGADALIFDQVVKAAGELQGFKVVERYIYKGHMVTFRD